MLLIKLSAALLLTLVLSACASKHVKMYEGPELPDDQTVSILFRSRLGPAVESIDGVDAPSSAIQIGRLIMKPGRHHYGVVVNYDPKFDGYGISLKWARGTVDIDGEAGHTYAFHWEPIDDKTALFWYEDLGKDFPEECFDIRRWWSEPERFEELGCR